MHPYLKTGLLFCGGLFLLGLWDRSRAIVTAIRAKELAAVNTTQVGGKNLPNPVNAPSAASNGPLTNESALANANPDTVYGDDYLGAA